MSNKEEALDILQKAYHAESKQWNPQFAGAIKTAIDVLVVEVSKQKMKEVLNEK